MEEGGKAGAELKGSYHGYDPAKGGANGNGTQAAARCVL